MPKPYSLDLRERVVRFVDEGHSRHAAAAHLVFRWPLSSEPGARALLSANICRKPSVRPRGLSGSGRSRRCRLETVARKADSDQPERGRWPPPCNTAVRPFP